MSSSKIDRAIHGPGWGEIIFGAALSVALGVVLAAAHLMFKPIVHVKVMPREPLAGEVYFQEGSKDPNKGMAWLRKRQAFLEGQSIDLTEDELNTAVATPTEKPKGGTGPGGAAPAAPASDALLTPGSVNFRIAQGKLQVASEVKVNLFDTSVMVQTTGGFEKKGDTFSFVPQTFFVGSCPLHRLPFVQDLVLKRFFPTQSIPEDLASAWKKLADVKIEDRTLKLMMP
jgi:hypothetical protein